MLEIFENRPVGIETERIQSIGVAFALVGIDPSRNGENALDPKIRLVLERKTKPETEKTAGQISCPGETQKIGENLASNILGAVAEVTDNDFLIRNNLFFMPSSYIPGKVSIKGNPVDLFVAVYEGSLAVPFQPVDQNDVMSYGWMTVNEINEVARRDPEKVRKFTRQIAKMETSERPIGRVVAEYFHSPLSRIPFSTIFPSGFSSIRQFHQERESGKIDIRVFERRASQK